MSIRTTIPCILAAIWWALIAGSAQATTRNIAPLAQARASSEQDGAHAAHCINDGIIGVMGKGSWASDSKMMFWGEIDYPWIELEWEQEVCIDRVVIYDRPEAASTCSGGELVFDNGQKLSVRNIPSDGTAREVRFPARHTRRLRFNVTDGNHSHIGLSEIEVFEAPQAATAYIHMADPYIETTRGRYFYFVTGSTPFGMISAAPLTRNKNQGGGGYNYNDTEVLGFPQIHGWMLSGLDLMPTTGDINPTLGEEGWKSAFSHASEIVQPAYHRMFLHRYGLWVEQTCTDRTSLYRITTTQDAQAHVLLNLGGFIGTTTMVNAHAQQTGDNRIEGYFDSTGRLWGGPDKVRIWFVAEFSKPFEGLTAWNDGTITPHATQLEASPHATPRNEGMSYSDAPTAGMYADYTLKADEPRDGSRPSTPTSSLSCPGGLTGAGCTRTPSTDGALRSLMPGRPHSGCRTKSRNWQHSWGEKTPCVHGSTMPLNSRQAATSSTAMAGDIYAIPTSPDCLMPMCLHMPATLNSPSTGHGR